MKSQEERVPFGSKVGKEAGREKRSRGVGSPS